MPVLAWYYGNSLPLFCRSIFDSVIDLLKVSIINKIYIKASVSLTVVTLGYYLGTVRIGILVLNTNMNMNYTDNNTTVNRQIVPILCFF